MEYWLGDKNFPQWKLFPSEKFFPDKVYLIFIKVLNEFSHPAKKRPTSFSAVTPANIGIRPQNFLTYSFNLFIKTIPSASSKLLNLN